MKLQMKIYITQNDFNSIDMELKEYLDNIIYLANSLGDSKYIELRLWNIDSKSHANLNGEIVDYICGKFGYREIIDTKKQLNYKLKDNVYLMFGRCFDWPDMDSKDYGEYGYCYALKDQIGILVNGDVVPCCLDNNGTMVLGNIFDSAMQEILDTDRAKNIINGFRQRKRVEELCRHCGFATRFDK